MKKIFTVILVLVLLVGIYGCRSIRVGGSGQIKGIHGHGGVDIPIPSK